MFAGYSKFRYTLSLCPLLTRIIGSLLYSQIFGVSRYKSTKSDIWIDNSSALNSQLISAKHDFSKILKGLQNNNILQQQFLGTIMNLV